MTHDEQVIEEAKKTYDEKKQKEVVVRVDQKGLFEFSNHRELFGAASMAVQISLAPKHLASNINAVMRALTLCRQYRLPMQAMNQMSYIEGRLTCFGSLVTALAERHPDYGEHEMFFIDEESNQICVANKNLKAIPWAHVMRVKKKGSTVWNEYFFSVDDAEQAGLLTKQTKPGSGWIKYTKDLLYHKTKARALKANYASALEGIEYHEDLQHDLKPAKSVDGPDLGERLNAINEKFAKPAMEEIVVQESDAS